MRVLIMSASTGGGHMRTSAAMKNYIEAHRPNDTVRIVDTLEYVGHLYNKTVSDGYVFMAKNTPKLYGTFYNSANKDNALNNMATKFNKTLSKKLLPLIVEFMPDVIIVVHAFAAEMASTLRTKYNMKVPVICIITDFAPHKMYIQDNINKYVVSSDEMVTSLEDLGVPKNKIESLGIPIDVSFYEKYDRNQLMEEMELDPQKSTLLLMAGSFGVTDILKIYQSIVEVDADFQIVVITGRNKKLYDAFEKLLTRSGVISDEELHTPADETEEEYTDITQDTAQNAEVTGKKTKKRSELSLALKDSAENLKVTLKDNAENLKDTLKENAETIKDGFKETLKENKLIKKLYTGIGSTGSKPTKLLYFVNDVNKYMYIADLIVTKPGGLTVSEAIASSLPMAIFKAYPGQEEENADFLTRNHMAVKLPKGEKCTQAIQNLLSNPDKLKQMKESCRKMYKEQSAQQVLELADKLIQEEKEV